MERRKTNNRRINNIHYRKTENKLSLSEFTKERLELKLQTLDMYNKGYVSDFYHRMALKHGWYDKEGVVDDKSKE